MTAATLGIALPWTPDEEAERRYASVLMGVLLPLMLLALLLPVLPLFETPEDEKPEVPERLVKLVIEQEAPEPPPPPPPKPEPREEPPEQPKPAAQPQPEPKPEQTREAARRKAEKSGVLAFANDLAELRDNRAAESVSRRDLSASASERTVTGRKLITSKVKSGATGIAAPSGGAGQLSGSTELAGRSTTRVEGPPGGGRVSGGTSRSGTGGQATRTTEQIQIVFDRNKSSLFRIYQRALRSNPTLQGTVVLKLEIQPSGAVSSVSIVSSELNNETLEEKIVNRVKLLDFGAKNVPVWRGNYPIKFFPS